MQTETPPFRRTPPLSHLHIIFLKLLCCRLIDPKTRKLPIGIGKRTWILRHVVCTRARARVLRIVNVLCTSEGAAEVDVCNDALVLEVRVDVTVGAGEVGERFAPC